MANVASDAKAMAIGKVSGDSTELSVAQAKQKWSDQSSACRQAGKKCDTNSTGFLSKQDKA